MRGRTGERRRRTQWQAMLRGLRYRLVIPVFRSPHSAEYTARGVANGVFWGLTPTVGLQTIEIFAAWFAGRRLGFNSSLLQAYIWAWVNNPVTMIPLYYTYYVTGLWLLGDIKASTGYAGFVDVWTAATALGWWTGFVAVVRAIGEPLFLGSVPYTVVGTLLAYRWSVRVLRRRQQRLRTGAAPAPTGA
jgi:uncharacterized protein